MITEVELYQTSSLLYHCNYCTIADGNVVEVKH